MSILLGIFNPAQFAALLKKAIGSRSAYKFAQDVGVSRNHINLLLNQERNSPPKPETLKKFADGASNGVTYEDFLITAGLMADNQEEIAIKKTLDAKNLMLEDLENENYRVTKVENIISDDISGEFKDLHNSVTSFMQENEVTKEELEQCLLMLRALKKSKKKSSKK